MIRSFSRLDRKTTLLLLMLLCTVQLLPFVARPFHIDDPMFVWTAQHIVQHPRDFYGFEVNWEGTNRLAAKIFPIPPVTSYLLAGLSRVVGWSEVGLHLCFLPISCLIAAGIYCLADRFTRRPALCVLLVLLSPGFWVSATTLMCDGLLLCLWVWSVVFWIWGCEKSGWYLVPAAATVSCAILTKFTALGLLPLLAFYSILMPTSARNRIGRWIPVLLALIAPVVIFSAYDRVFKTLYGVGALDNAAYYSSASQALLHIPVITRLTNSLVFVAGGCLTAGLVVLIAIWKSRSQIAVVAVVAALTPLIAAAITVPTGWLAHSNGRLWFSVQLVVLLCLGMVMVIEFGRFFVRDYRRGVWRDDAFLLAWIAGIFLFVGFFNWSINVRSVLPMAPAICIMVARSLDSLSRVSIVRVVSAVLMGGAVALAVTVGDDHLATAAKSAAEQTPRELATATTRLGLKSPPTCWIAGHWGLQYYLQPRGYPPLDIFTPGYKPGDFVLFPANGFGGAPDAQGFILVRNFTVGAAQYAATAEPAMGAGFYHSDGSLLPFVFGPIPAQSFALVQVTDRSRVHR
jgi:hypothetical protein